MKNILVPACSLLILSWAALAFADEIIATDPDQPGQYVTANQTRADQELNILSPESGNALKPNASTVATSLPLTHGADVMTMSSRPSRTPPPGTLPVGTAVLRERPLTGCTTITQGGRYVLQGNISSSKTCITVKADNVELQCNGKTINGDDIGISVQSTRNFSMTCDVTGGNYGVSLSSVTGFSIQNSHTGIVQITGSQKGQINNNELTGVNASNSQYVTTSNNKINGGYDQGKCSYMTVSGNDISYKPNSYQNGIALFEGNHNTVSGNRIDGGWKGYANEAYDNGIQVDGESYAAIKSNTIKNTYNNGMEINGHVTHSLVESNDISHVASAGIGANYGTSWEENVIRNNTVTEAGSFSSILYSADAGNNYTTRYFRDNTIEGNVFRPDRYATGASFSVNLMTRADGQPLSAPLVAENNIIRNNDFGMQAAAPRANPSEAFIDGGGNICSAARSQYSFLACQQN